eukprot:8727740-Pyramimonas_sp.AAC.1
MQSSPHVPFHRTLQQVPDDDANGSNAPLRHARCRAREKYLARPPRRSLESPQIGSFEVGP